MTGKKEIIENMLTSLEPDIFLAVESKLSKDVNDSEFLPSPYRTSPPVRKDRVRGGGGVFIATKDHIIAEPLKSLDSDCEICWIRVQLHSNKQVIVGVFYSPQATIESYTELRLSLTKLREKFPNTPIFLGGDFNLPGIDWNTYTHIPMKVKKGQSELLLEIAHDFHLEQLNLECTRHQSILELLFTSHPESILSCSTGPGISDHDHLVIARVDMKPKHQQKTPRTIHLFRKADWTEIKKHLSASSTSLLQSPDSKSSDEMWCFFRDTIKQAIDKFVPQKRISGKCKIPWLSHAAKRQIRRKRRLYRRAKKENSPEAWNCFRAQRKIAQQALRKSHIDYLNNIFREEGNKGMWSYIKNKKGSSSGGVGILRDNNKVGIEPRDKAEMLNAQFASVFCTDEPSDPPVLSASPFPQMPKINVVEAGISALLRKLDPRKASGADGIPAVFLKECATELAPMLTAIAQKSLDTKEVPSDWKRALVSPVFKKGDRSKPENYRPISLTSICCKIVEHVVVSETMKHLDANNILDDRQHGFRKRRSCETQLHITTHDLASILNRHSQADVAVLDFSKAFDKVSHSRLMLKLNHCNLHPDAVGWIGSFLAGRTQRVVVDGYTSDECPVTSGVPQGSVLGPILFLIFINDIASSIQSSIRLFADHCLLYRQIDSILDQ